MHIKIKDIDNMSFGGFIEWSKDYHSYDEVKIQRDLPLYFQSFALEIGNRFIYHDVIYKLIAVSETNEGYYLVGENDRGKKKYILCEESVYFIKDA